MRTAILVAVTLLSCEGPDYTLSALDTALPSVDPELGDDLEMEPSEHAGGSALAGWEDAPSGMVEELHEVGEGSENPVTDFLFVIDPLMFYICIGYNRVAQKSLLARTM